MNFSIKFLAIERYSISFTLVSFKLLRSLEMISFVIGSILEFDSVVFVNLAFANSQFNIWSL
jgi:hypothetical protein